MPTNPLDDIARGLRMIRERVSATTGLDPVGWVDEQLARPDPPRPLGLLSRHAELVCEVVPDRLLDALADRAERVRSILERIPAHGGKLPRNGPCPGRTGQSAASDAVTKA